MPELTDVVLGYSPAEATAISGASYRQVDYWARIGILMPSVRNAAGSGSSRCYSFDDVVVLTAVVQATRGHLAAIEPPPAPWLLRAIQFARLFHNAPPLTSEICFVVQAHTASLMSKDEAVKAVCRCDHLVTVLPLAPAIEHVTSQTRRGPVREVVNG